MIFEYIRFKNYRPYYGEQTLYLKRKSTDSLYNKNIVLIGGLNGHGKTSLINAVHICLFGHRKFRNRKEYEDYISKSVNNKHVQEGGNSGFVELAFTDDTGTYAIRVEFIHNLGDEYRKVYKLNSDLKKEREIQLTEEEYFDFIDSRIPLDAAQFFIFDAEKIRDLVGDQEKEETIQAIQKVVSLELYNQLLKDIDKIYNDLTYEMRNNTTNEQAQALFDKLKSISDEIDEKEEQLQEVQARLAELWEEVQEKSRERRKIIAQNSSTKTQLSKRIGEYEAKLKRIEKDLTHSKSRLYMLILLPLIQQLKKRIKNEKEYKNALEREKQMFAPYEEFIEKLLNAEVRPKLSPEQKEQLKNYGKIIWAKLNKIQTNIASKKMEILHDLSHNDYHKILSYPETMTSDIGQLVQDKQRYEGLLKNAINEFEDAPEEIDTSDLDRKINELNQEIGDLKGKSRLLRSRINELTNERFRLNRQLTDMQKKLKKIDPLQKKLDLVKRLREATQEFIDEVTIMKAKQLKQEIETIIQQLFRKEDFHQIVFDPDEFILRIYDQYEKQIDLQSRSEGEKQLIALAMIWALTKVSGSDFPFVIDTPLARLDSIHRTNLVNHYFTKLSDQVIILSTDTEITYEFYQQLEPFISQKYILRYDDELKHTVVEEGYFFEGGVPNWQV